MNRRSLLAGAAAMATAGAAGLAISIAQSTPMEVTKVGYVKQPWCVSRFSGMTVRSITRHADGSARVFLQNDWALPQTCEFTTDALDIIEEHLEYMRAGTCLTFEFALDPPPWLEDD